MSEVHIPLSLLLMIPQLILTDILVVVASTTPTHCDVKCIKVISDMPPYIQGPSSEVWRFFRFP